MVLCDRIEHLERKVSDLEAENERLRAVLREIEHTKFWRPVEMQRKAAEALRQYD